MPSTRKAIRDAIKTVLSHSTKGFNARLATIAGSYGITAFTIDFGTGSTSFFQGFVDPAQLELTQLVNDDSAPVWLNIYTSTAQGTNRTKPRTFSGEVAAHVDFIFRFRDGMEVDDTESVLDAAEDAAVSCLFDPTAGWPTGVILSPIFAVPREPAVLLGDGWMQRVPMILTFEADV